MNAPAATAPDLTLIAAARIVAAAITDRSYRAPVGALSCSPTDTGDTPPAALSPSAGAHKSAQHKPLGAGGEA